MTKPWDTHGLGMDGNLSTDESSHIATGGTRTMTKLALIDNTTGQRWDGYKTEAQLRTVAKLYSYSHPRSSVSFVIGEVTHKIR